MRWAAREGGWKKRFAWLPVKIGDEWIWFEPYESQFMGEFSFVRLFGEGEATDPPEAKLWCVVCWDDDGDRSEFNFTERAEYDAFMAGLPRGVSVSDIREAYQHTAQYALAALPSHQGAE